MKTDHPAYISRRTSWYRWNLIAKLTSGGEPRHTVAIFAYQFLWDSPDNILKILHSKQFINLCSIPYLILRGTMGGISVISVKNHFFILLNKFDLHTIIYDSLKFQISVSVV